MTVNFRFACCAPPEGGTFIRLRIELPAAQKIYDGSFDDLLLNPVIVVNCSCVWRRHVPVMLVLLVLLMILVMTLTMAVLLAAAAAAAAVASSDAATADGDDDDHQECLRESTHDLCKVHSPGVSFFFCGEFGFHVERLLLTHIPALSLCTTTDALEALLTVSCWPGVSARLGSDPTRRRKVDNRSHKSSHSDKNDFSEDSRQDLWFCSFTDLANRFIALRMFADSRFSVLCRSLL